MSKLELGSKPMFTSTCTQSMKLNLRQGDEMYKTLAEAETNERKKKTSHTHTPVLSHLAAMCRGVKPVGSMLDTVHPCM